MRLNKYLADCGVASRRACDKLIEVGKVSVNGKTATLGLDVDPEVDKILVEGRRVSSSGKMYYLVLHKPKGYVTTASDELGRKTVMDLIDIKARLFPIGRLDYDTEGLLIFTNDGDLSNKLTHPSSEINKVYVARLSGKLAPADVVALEKGIELDGKPTAPCKVRVLEQDDHHTRVELTIHEGRNRQVKRMFEAIGKEVEFLKRTQVGELHLGGLSRGKYRFCTPKEVAYLKSL
jgi:pseudouridine synthase